jgi:hypothetical protein
MVFRLALASLRGVRLIVQRLEGYHLHLTKAVRRNSFRAMSRGISSAPHIIFGGLEVLLVRLEDIVVANPNVVDSLIL